MVRVNLWDARRWQRKFESKQGPNPLFYQCTFKPNRIIYRTYKYHFFTFSQLSKTLAPFLSRGDFEGDYFLTFLTTGNLAYSVVLTADLKLRLVELRRRPENGFTITPVADLFTALRRALNADKYEELKESKLGVFIKFKELNFGWALRLVHYMLSFQLNIKKKVEVTKEMAAFWEMMGVDVDDGPTTEHIKAAFGRCEEWSREDRMRLGYLAIFTGFIEGRKYSTATWASLARLVWAYFALPEFGANFGHPLPDRPSPLLLAYNGGRERIFFKEAISKQTSVINFVHKDYAEMFPRWDFDVEDPAAENIIKVMFNAKANWKWTMDCWEVTESARPRKKARKEAFVEASKVPSAGFSKSDASTSEIKLLGDRIEAVEKKVGITKKGTASNELQITTSNPEKRGHEPGSESVNGAKAGKNDAQEPKQSGEPSLLVLDKEVPTDSYLQKGETRRQIRRNAAMVHQTPFKGNNTVKVIIPNKRVGQGYDPFAPFDKKIYFKTPMAKKPRRCPSRFYFTLRTPLKWLNDGHMDAFINVLRQRYQDNPHHFRSERLCFLDHVFSRQWSHHYPEFKSDEGDINGLGRRLPGGAWNYHHWIAIWISIPKRHIVVWDSILTHISAADLDVLMEPFVNMVPYLFVECAGSDEERVKHTLEPYTYERVTVGVPQCRAALCNKNLKAIREKMALDIFKETPECHAKENEDNDENLATYDQQG
ncbi:unnamed protein product [Brassica napus]|uniref:(rape) hypothetical protein n=1 Tax=Brassica napus TaxID=3708 RepID=A0A816IVQ4_BRANA|nr:unnamed protein product [Brassica napus]